MIWEKLGKIFTPSGDRAWMHSHAQVPFVINMGDYVRIFFSTRSAKDDKNQFKSFSSYVDINPRNNWEIIKVASNPILELGGIGEFDEFGIMAGSIVKKGSEYLLYYCGWQRLQSVPYNWAIGLASSSDLSKFKKVSCGPILGPRMNEPFLHACPIVYEVSNGFEMYLLTGDKWIKDERDKLESVYTLKRSFSEDGINWKPVSKALLEPKSQYECQTSCSIFEYNSKHVMVFSYRSGLNFRTSSQHSYKLGYAELKNGKWVRLDDELQFYTKENEDWDQMMQAYPHVFDFDDEKYMLYCGNSFGECGFGLAKLIE